MFKAPYYPPSETENKKNTTPKLKLGSNADNFNRIN